MALLPFLAIGLSFMQATLAEAPSPIAVSCEGTWKRSVHQVRKPIEHRTRVYIIDEAQKDVLFWNPGFGRSFSLCDTSILEACTFEFSPNIIMSKSTSKGGHSINVIIDRQGGTFWSLEDGDGELVEFKADYAKIAMPHADLGQRKF